MQTETIALNGYAIFITKTPNGDLRVYGATPNTTASPHLGDEIKEINGQRLDRLSQEELMALIHECVQSKTVRLRVKRLAKDQAKASQAEVKNAYVIATDIESKRSLCRSTPLKNVSAVVDLSKLSVALQQKPRTDTYSLPKQGACDDNDSEQFIKQVYSDCLLSTEDLSCVPTLHQRSSEHRKPHFAFDDNKENEANCSRNIDQVSRRAVGRRHQQPPQKYRLNKPKAGQSPTMEKQAIPQSRDNGLAGAHCRQEDESNTQEKAVDASVARNVDSKDRAKSSDDHQHKDRCNYSHSPWTQKDIRGGDHDFNGSVRLLADENVKPQQHNFMLMHDTHIQLHSDKYRQDRFDRQQQIISDLGQRSEKTPAPHQDAWEIDDSTKGPITDNRKSAYRKVHLTRLDADPGEHPSSTVDTCSLITQPPPLLAKPFDMNDLFDTISKLQKTLTAPQDQQCLDQLAKIFSEPKFRRALRLQSLLVRARTNPDTLIPDCADAQRLSEDVLGVIDQSWTQLNEKVRDLAGELRSILEKATFSNGVLLSHDLIADHCAPARPPLPEEEKLAHKAAAYGEPNLKIVRLVKTSDYPLGATIRNDPDSRRVLIGRIVRGGAAEQSGLLQINDEILEINDEPVRGLDIDKVCSMLIDLNGPLTFLIVPADAAATTGPTTCSEQATSSAVRSLPCASAQNPRHLRAMFRYSPSQDVYIPCKELGVVFDKGEILHVVDDHDEHWWQAYKDTGEIKARLADYKHERYKGSNEQQNGDDQQQLAGLIPSKSFQEKRESCLQFVVGADTRRRRAKKKSSTNVHGRRHKLNCSDQAAAGSLCLKVKSGSKKKPYALYADDPCGVANEILTYEEVSQYYQEPNRKRPLILVGSQHAGHHELLKMLIDYDPEHFTAPIPHTTRCQRDEPPGSYHFVSRDNFERKLADGQFLEYGHFNKEWYGTSIDSIRSVIQSGKTCVFAIDNPEVLNFIRRPDIKPYTILIRPRSINTPKASNHHVSQSVQQQLNTAGESRSATLQSGSSTLTNVKKLTENKIHHILEETREIEDEYGHLLDLQLVNDDFERTFNELVDEANRLELEPRWVPSEWLI